MASYPPPGSGYPPYGAAPGAQPYGAPQNPYGAAPGAQPYGAAPGAQPYGDKPKKDKYGQAGDAAHGGDPYAAQSHGYGAQPHGYGAPVPAPYGAQPYGEKPPKDKYGAGAGAPGAYGAAPGAYVAAPYGAAPAPVAGYGDPFAALKPSAFPPGTDPNLVASFQAADRDGSGLIDDKELQAALSSYNQTFSMRTVHLLMYLFTGTNVRKIGPKEFSSVFYCLQNWRAIFERFDRDRSGKIDMNELREALLSLGFSVSPIVLDLLVSKFDKSGGKLKAIEYDNFIECCLTVKGLTEKFKEKDLAFSGSATFTYDAFMLTVLPFLVA